ncbi:MAG: iron transporter [Clostridiales bacterium]|nr:iron transporter [Clostridiales bacterium]
MKKTIRIIPVLLAVLLLAGCGAPAAPAVTAAPTVAEETAAVTSATPTQETEPAVAAKVLPDGEYTVDFETDSGMFRANEACNGKGTLTVKDGIQTLHVSLQSKKIVNLYVGTAEDAQQSGAVWLEPTLDTVTYSDGLSEDVFGFDIPVVSVGQEFDLAIIGTKGVWYDHRVSVQNPVPQAGTYTCEVTLNGGSGRASVASPAEISSDGETLTATIQWSSPHYEYMIVDGVQYDPIQQEGNSTFQIPVVLDADMAVSASTVAMSEPHLVEYTLYFDSATLAGK